MRLRPLILSAFLLLACGESTQKLGDPKRDGGDRPMDGGASLRADGNGPDGGATGGAIGTGGTNATAPYLDAGEGDSTGNQGERGGGGASGTVATGGVSGADAGTASVDLRPDTAAAGASGGGTSGAAGATGGGGGGTRSTGGSGGGAPDASHDGAGPDTVPDVQPDATPDMAPDQGPDAGESCSATTPCPTGQSCNAGLCVLATLPQSCGNHQKDPLETDTDCGGPSCLPCVAGACLTDSDCASMHCLNSVCAAPNPSYQVDEDFETGTLTKFPYQLAADAAHDWVIEDGIGACHGGQYCGRTSPFHASSEVSSIVLGLSVRKAGNVSFWAKTDTEVGQHFLRFSIDGVRQVELSGQHDWQLYSFPVSATGAGGPDRVLKWEYTRSSYVDPGHAPYNTVWIDDIDLPEWNSQPSVPRLLMPGNGKVVGQVRPTLTWSSSDPDLDRIIFEAQYDTDPAFPAPTTTGETTAFSSTPATDLVDGTVYYWRVRAKDESDYRWGGWAPTSSFYLDSKEDRNLWRQNKGPEFKLGTLSNISVAGDVVQVAGTTYTVAGEVPDTGHIETIQTATLTGLPPARSGAGATLELDAFVYAATGIPHCYPSNSVVVDFVAAADTAQWIVNATGHDCQVNTVPDTHVLDNVQQHIASDGALTVSVQVASDRRLKGFNYKLTYETVNAGTITSVPIRLSEFDGASNWESLSFDADPGVKVQVLDSQKVLVPDTAVPGNGAGLSPGSRMFWGLEAQTYPVIYLRASLTGSQQLRRWEVSANTGYRWSFANANDSEGWQAGLDGATVSVAVKNGVLRLEAPIGGSNPRLLYTMPAEVDASRFRELVVRARSTNNTSNDVVTVFWQNNFGLIDPVRSFNKSAFLYQQTDVTFDLAQATVDPQQPWQGRISALRVDPVDRFFDAVGNAVAGWFEVDSIWLR